MTLPRLQADASSAVAFDDRSTADAMIDMAASSLRGALLACEAEFDGEMSISWEILIRTANEFLDDVRADGGDEAVAAYAQRMADEMLLRAK